MNLFSALKRKPQHLSFWKPALCFIALFFMAAVFSPMPAEAELFEPELENFSLSAPTAPATLTTRAPGEEASVELSATGEVPPGQWTQPHGGFKFAWTLAPADIQKLVPGTTDDWAAAPDVTGVSLTPPAPIMDKPYLFPDIEGIGTQKATLKAKFPTVGTYRMKVKVIGRWNLGTGPDYVSEEKTLDVIMVVADVEISFTGLPRACAGGVDDLNGEEAHIFTLSFNAKQGEENMATKQLQFSFVNNQSHDPNRKAKFLTSPNPRTWSETALITTDTNGNGTIKILSSDLISEQTKIVVKYDGDVVEGIKLNGNTIQNGVLCDFDSVFTYRRFFNEFDPDETEDTGWKINVPRLSQPGNTTPATVYLKHMINRDGHDVQGNWKYVNQHQLRIKVVKIILRDNSVILGTPEQLKDYAFIVDPANSQASARTIATGLFANEQGIFDGAAQVTVKAGSNIKNVASILIGAEELTQFTP